MIGDSKVHTVHPTIAIDASGKISEFQETIKKVRHHGRYGEQEKVKEICYDKKQKPCFQKGPCVEIGGVPGDNDNTVAIGSGDESIMNDAKYESISIRRSPFGNIVNKRHANDGTIGNREQKSTDRLINPDKTNVFGVKQEAFYGSQSYDIENNYLNDSTLRKLAAIKDDRHIDELEKYYADSNTEQSQVDDCRHSGKELAGKVVKDGEPEQKNDFM